MGELLKECLLVKLVEETRWRENRQVAASSNTSNVSGGNLPTFGSPRKVGSEQVAQLTTTTQKDSRQS